MSKPWSGYWRQGYMNIVAVMLLNFGAASLSWTADWRAFGAGVVATFVFCALGQLGWALDESNRHSQELAREFRALRGSLDRGRPHEPG